MLEQLGTWGYWMGASGIILINLVFAVAVPWWNDILGRLIMGVLTALSLVLGIIILRQLGVELPGSLVLWRAIVFWVFGLAVWTALGTFIWAQYMAGRVQKNRLTTRRERASK